MIFTHLKNQFAREMLCAFRQPGDALAPVVFFLIIGTLFPLALGSDPQLLVKIGPGAIWIAALLSVLLSLHRLYRADLESGYLDQLLLMPSPLFLLVNARLFAHWLQTGVPMLLATPLLAEAFGLNYQLIPVLLASLALGTPVLLVLGAINEALTLASRGGALLALLVLPLYVPTLVFGSGA
ncbi:MAG: heme exporter protein CcmB, partial [Immundisolibacteraceae bacterium]|nr:heme exporter protein CcmB [Immundisolibacteraceae bacterium]